eukprot:Rhum_TRINITY_DN14281_c7_g1::Rhum_TRINITY_DN14281_c7_g1_i1::g.76859::m.76859
MQCCDVCTCVFVCVCVCAFSKGRGGHVKDFAKEDSRVHGLLQREAATHSHPGTLVRRRRVGEARNGPVLRQLTARLFPVVLRELEVGLLVLVARDRPGKVARLPHHGTVPAEGVDVLGVEGAPRMLLAVEGHNELRSAVPLEHGAHGRAVDAGRRRERERRVAPRKREHNVLHRVRPAGGLLLGQRLHRRHVPLAPPLRLVALGQEHQVARDGLVGEVRHAHRRHLVPHNRLERVEVERPRVAREDDLERRACGLVPVGAALDVVAVAVQERLFRAHKVRAQLDGLRHVAGGPRLHRRRKLLHDLCLRREHDVQRVGVRALHDQLRHAERRHLRRPEALQAEVVDEAVLSHRAHRRVHLLAERLRRLRRHLSAVGHRALAQNKAETVALVGAQPQALRRAGDVADLQNAAAEVPPVQRQQFVWHEAVRGHPLRCDGALVLRAADAERVLPQAQRLLDVRQRALALEVLLVQRKVQVVGVLLVPLLLLPLPVRLRLVPHLQLLLLLPRRHARHERRVPRLHDDVELRSPRLLRRRPRAHHVVGALLQPLPAPLLQRRQGREDGLHKGNLLGGARPFLQRVGAVGGQVGGGVAVAEGGRHRRHVAQARHFAAAAHLAHDEV